VINSVAMRVAARRSRVVTARPSSQPDSRSRPHSISSITTGASACRGGAAAGSHWAASTVTSSVEPSPRIRSTVSSHSRSARGSGTVRPRVPTAEGCDPGQACRPSARVSPTR
jgi:hypothetical protein